jgi:hypothetical protein
MQLQRVRVLRLRPEELGAKLFVALYAEDSTQLSRRL